MMPLWIYRGHIPLISLTKMKIIRIALINFWPSLNFAQTQTYKLLSRHFDIKIVDENPDFVLASCFGDISNVLRFDCPRIQVLGEPVTPDFTLFDYAIGFDFLQLNDGVESNRFFRYPVAFWEWHADEASAIENTPSYEEAKKILQRKTRFCDFIYGYETKPFLRESILNSLEKYKRVDCAGTYRNNMPDNYTVRYNREPSKISFMRESKFSIAGENMSYPGMVTEKIVDSFFANSVPIYIGDPLVSKTFNPKAFINANDFKTENELLAEVMRIDNDDDAYLRMLSAPKFNDEQYFSNLLKEYESFLVSVFGREGENAFRRPRYYFAARYEALLKTAKIKMPIRRKVRALGGRLLQFLHLRKER